MEQQEQKLTKESKETYHQWQRLAESAAVPRELLRDLHVGLANVEEVLATLEELSDKEGFERIHQAEKERQNEEHVTAQRGSEIKELAEWTTASDYRAALTKKLYIE